MLFIMTRRLPLLWTLLIITTGCGDNEAVIDQERATTLSKQALEENSCVTLQRGGTGSVADTSISSQQAGHDMGSQPYLYVGQLGQHRRLGLLRFDISSIPPHATVTSATLKLWRQGAPHTSRLTAHAITAEWHEASASWDGFGNAFAAAVAGSAQASGGASSVNVALTELVTTWVRSPSLNRGLVLQQLEGHSVLASSEASEANRRPQLEICYVLPDSSPATSSAPSVLLQVMDEAGQPLSGAMVYFPGVTLTTDSAGYVVLDNLPMGFFNARVDAIGFAPAVVSLHLPPGAHAAHQVRLQPLGPPQPFAVEEGAVLERGPVRVSIAPNSVVNMGGYPVTGTVHLTIAPLDPKFTPASALPGPLEGVETEDAEESVPLESFFMAEISLWDGEEPLQLAPGTTATVEILLPETISAGLSPGQTIPAWWLDLKRGLWVREGSGMIQPAASHPGRLSWVVQVAHFTWWNADAPLSDRHCLDVLVSYPNGLPAQGAQVGAVGIDYTGVSRTAFTGADGRACVEIKRGGSARIFAGVPDGPSAEATVAGNTTTAAACGSGSCTFVPLRMPTMLCTPGDTRKCAYTGPAGTENVGECRAARRYCNTTGTAWTSCTGEVSPSAEEQNKCINGLDYDCDGLTGEGCNLRSCYWGPPGTRGVSQCKAGTIRTSCHGVSGRTCCDQTLPATETCATAVDDDCNGSTTCSNPITLARSFPGSGCDYAERFIMNPDGSSFLMASFEQSLDMGNGSSLSGTGLAIAKLDANLNTAWAHPAYGWISPHSFKTDQNGDLILIAYFNGPLTLAGEVINAGPGDGLVVAKFTHSTGNLLRLSRFIGSQGFNSYASSIDISSTGDVILTGEFIGNLVYDGGVLNNPSGRDAFVARISDDTGVSLMRHFDSTESVGLSEPVLDFEGNVVVTGYFTGDVSLGETTLHNPAGHDGFVAKLMAGNDADLMEHLDAGQHVGAWHPIVEATGNVVVIGHFIGDLAFGGNILINPKGQDAFVARWIINGGIDVLNHFDSTSYISLHNLKMDSDNNPVLLGGFVGNLTHNGTTLHNPSGYDMLIARVALSSGIDILKHIDMQGGISGWNLTFDNNKNIIFSGMFTGGLKFGGMSLRNPSWTDLIVARVAIDGGADSVRHIDASSYFYLTHPGSPLVDLNGDVIVAGTFYGDLSLAGTTLRNPNGADAFVAKLGLASGVDELRHLATAEFGSIDKVLGSAGNVFVSGKFSGDTAFGGTLLRNPSGGDAFVAKVGFGGGVDEIKHFDSASYLEVWPYVANPLGNVFVTGYFYGDLSFGGSILRNPTGYDTFISSLKFGASSPDVLRHIGSSEHWFGWGMFEPDSAGNAIISGAFNDRLYAGGVTLSNSSLPAPDHFVLRFQADVGSLAWVRQLDSPESANVSIIEMDNAGNVFLFGHFSQTLGLGGSTPLTSMGCGDLFLAKLPP